MFGMVLAIGILVDDAIVVVENVERIMARPVALAATRKAMGQISGAIVGITVVLVSVFIPMAFFGLGGQHLPAVLAVDGGLDPVLGLPGADADVPAPCDAARRWPMTTREEGLLRLVQPRFQLDDARLRGLAGRLASSAAGRAIWWSTPSSPPAGATWLPTSFLPNEDQGT